MGNSHTDNNNRDSDDVPWYKWMDTESVTQIASQIALERKINEQLLTTTDPREIPDSQVPDINPTIDFSRGALLALLTFIYIEQVHQIISEGTVNLS